MGNLNVRAIEMQLWQHGMGPHPDKRPAEYPTQPVKDSDKK